MIVLQNITVYYILINENQLYICFRQTIILYKIIAVLLKNYLYQLITFLFFKLAFICNIYLWRYQDSILKQRYAKSQFYQLNYIPLSSCANNINPFVSKLITQAGIDPQFITVKMLCLNHLTIGSIISLYLKFFFINL